MLGSELTKGLLPCVISGGRPKLLQRPVAKILAELSGITAKPIWVVSENDACDYESDGNEVVAYSKSWADEYARNHWIGLKENGFSFYGAFVGREYACKIAEERGYWGVFQLDDNIQRVYVISVKSKGLAKELGGLGLAATFLSNIASSTNASMVGLNLAALPYLGEKEQQLARTGFPYSCFVEKVSSDREPWYGPFEDDILHAIQYHSSQENTAAVFSLMRYKKETHSKSGMRNAYNNRRSVPLNMIAPERSTLKVSRKLNGIGDLRIFHSLIHPELTNPLRVKNDDLWKETQDMGRWLVERYKETMYENMKHKVERKVALLRSTEE